MNKVSKTGKKVNGNLFIAAWLPKEARNALKHVKDLDDDLHMTILYVPDGFESEITQRQVYDAVEEACNRTKPIKCQLTAISIMDNEEKTLVSNVNTVDGSQFYSDLVETIESKIGRKIKREYGFLPHVTLRYKGKRDTANIKDNRKFKWTVDKISVQFGGEDSDKKFFNLKG